MAGLNKVMLIGNLGADPEIRDLESGSKVANFSIATSESFTNRNGEKQTQTEWHRIELWEGLARIAEQYLHKGDQVYIEGKIRNEKWTDKDGNEKTGVRIRGLSMQMLTPRGSESGLKPVENQPSSNVSSPVNQELEGEDDLPF